MSKPPGINRHHASFESIRQLDEQGNEYWSARDLAPLLDYQQWRNFALVIEKAQQACLASGNPVADARWRMRACPAMPAI